MSNTPNEGTKARYICTARCPELDNIGEGHCKSYDPLSECPCGNQPIWITLACEIGGNDERTYNN